MKKIAFVIPALLAATLAHAQAPAAAADDAIAPPPCDQPRYPGRTAPNRETDKFNKLLADYQKCMTGYIESQKKLADESLATQKAQVDELNDLIKKQADLKNKIALSIDRQKRHVEARNFAVNEYNTLMTRLKAEAGQ